MARPEKVAVVDRVSEQLTEANATLLTDYRGLSVEELAELRAELRKVDATYEVVKNTLTRLAAEKAGFEGLTQMLTGPTALVFCGDDPVGPAKAIKAFSKDHEELVLKGGYFEGSVMDAEEALKLADLASREELLATLAGMMNNALAGFARLLKAPLSDMARLQAALVEDGGVEAKGFSPSAPVAPEAPASDEAPSDEAPAEDDAPAAEEAAETVTEAADDAAEAVADAAESVAEAAPDAVADAAESAAETTAEVAQAAAEKVGDAAEAVADAVTGDDDESASDSDESDD